MAWQGNYLDKVILFKYFEIFRKDRNANEEGVLLGNHKSINCQRQNIDRFKSAAKIFLDSQSLNIFNKYHCHLPMFNGI